MSEAEAEAGAGTPEPGPGPGPGPGPRPADRADAEGEVRLEAVFHGRVQGVFFRATTRRVAEEHEVRGWVANESDGTVRLVAEGARRELERFLAAVQDAKRPNIAGVDVRWTAASGEFDGFVIRR